MTRSTSLLRDAAGPLMVEVVKVGTVADVPAAATRVAPTRAKAEKSRATSTPLGCRNEFSECGFQRPCARPRRTLAGGAASGVTRMRSRQQTQVGQTIYAESTVPWTGPLVKRCLTAPRLEPRSRWSMANRAARVRGWATNDPGDGAKGDPVVEADTVISAHAEADRPEEDHRAAAPGEALATRLHATSSRVRNGSRTRRGAAVAIPLGVLRTRVACPSGWTPGACRC